MKNIGLDNKVESLIFQIEEFVGDKGVVLGVSGGIDSALVASLAVKALGKDKVFFTYMSVTPGLEKLPASYVRAKELCDTLGVPLHIHTISTHSIINKMDVKVKPNALVEGNVAARLRMVTLYAYANALNYFVIGTGNKTEHEIGYFTKYGDGGVDFEPLGDLWKWEVYEMAEFLGVPSNILKASPSAELWDNQTDEDEIGVTYENLDRFLMGEDSLGDQTQSILNRISQNKHKSQLPPVFKAAR